MSVDSPGPSVPDFEMGNLKESGKVSKKVIEMEYRKEDAGPFQIIIESTNVDKNGISRMHPMALGKLITINHPDIASNTQTIKKLGRNRIRIELNNAISANKLLNSGILKEKGFHAYIPRYLLQRRGIIRGVDIELSEDEIKQVILYPNGTNHEILDIRRLKRKVINADTNLTTFVPTQSVMMVLRGQSLPTHVYIHYVSCEVHQYIQNVVQCKQCLRYGHYKDQCKGVQRCGKCGEPHDITACQSAGSNCVNCGDSSHGSTNQAICPSYKKEKRIKELMARNNISYYEAKTFTHDNSFAAIANGEVAPNVDDLGVFPLLGKSNKIARSFASTASFVRTTKRPRAVTPPRKPNFKIDNELLFSQPTKGNVTGGFISHNPHRTLEKTKLENTLEGSSDIIFETVFSILSNINVAKLKSWEEIDIKKLIKERIKSLEEVTSS